MSYLQKIGSRWYIRVVVPRDLEAQFPQKEFKRSLGVTSKMEARRLMPSMLAAVHNQFALKRTELMRPRISITPEAVSIFRRLHPGQETHIEVSPVQSFGGFNVPMPPLLEINPNLEFIQRQLDEGWQLNGSDEWVFVGVPRQVTFNPVSVVPVSIAEQPNPAAKVGKIGEGKKGKPLMLSEAIKVYRKHREDPDDRVHYKPMTKSTLDSDKYALAELRHWLEDKDVPVADLLDLNYKEFTVFLIDERGLGKESAKTRLRFVKFFFGYLHEFGYITRVPNITYPKKHGEEKIKTANIPYSQGELNTFLEFTSDNKPHKINERQSLLELRYLILMFLYTGFRGSEQTSFSNTGIKYVGTIPYFDFTEMSKDNVASIRMVPIHSKLIELGFLEFASKQAGKIFPLNLSTYRKRYNEILKTLELKGAPRSKTFHGCRATFDSKLAGKIQDSVRKTLMGHKKAGMDSIYVHQLLDEMPMYRDAVEKLVYNLDFDALKKALQDEIDDLYSSDGTCARKGRKQLI